MKRKASIASLKKGKQPHVFTVDEDVKKWYLCAIIGVAVTCIALFNLFWAPMLFLVVASWVVMNVKDQWSFGDMIGVAIVKLVLVYAVCARCFGPQFAFITAVCIALCCMMIYSLIWRRKK